MINLFDPLILNFDALNRWPSNTTAPWDGEKLVFDYSWKATMISGIALIGSTLSIEYSQTGEGWSHNVEDEELYEQVFMIQPRISPTGAYSGDDATYRAVHYVESDDGQKKLAIMPVSPAGLGSIYLIASYPEITITGIWLDRDIWSDITSPSHFISGESLITVSPPYNPTYVVHGNTLDTWDGDKYVGLPCGTVSTDADTVAAFKLNAPTVTRGIRIQGDNKGDVRITIVASNGDESSVYFDSSNDHEGWYYDGVGYVFAFPYEVEVDTIQFNYGPAGSSRTPFDISKIELTNSVLCPFWTRFNGQAETAS